MQPVKNQEFKGTNNFRAILAHLGKDTCLPQTSQPELDT